MPNFRAYGSGVRTFGKAGKISSAAARRAIQIFTASRTIWTLPSTAASYPARPSPADAGWEMPRLLAAMHQAPDFYFDSTSEIRMPCWSRGRVTLVGDACVCPSPLTGQGTSLALVGAYQAAALHSLERPRLQAGDARDRQRSQSNHAQRLLDHAIEAAQLVMETAVMRSQLSAFPPANGTFQAT
jgi:2-polyprenyl-6-methoxyphenol hydroxylase-like FAD-dependent oxidoreductase